MVVAGLAWYIIWLSKGHRQERDALVERLDRKDEQNLQTLANLAEQHKESALKGHEAARTLADKHAEALNNLTTEVKLITRE